MAIEDERIQSEADLAGFVNIPILDNTQARVSNRNCYLWIALLIFIITTVCFVSGTVADYKYKYHPLCETSYFTNCSIKSYDDLCKVTVPLENESINIIVNNCDMANGNYSCYYNGEHVYFGNYNNCIQSYDSYKYITYVYFTLTIPSCLILIIIMMMFFCKKNDNNNIH